MKQPIHLGMKIFSLSENFKSEVIQLQHKVLSQFGVENLIRDERNSSRLVEIKAGSVLVFSQFLCHRSGKNISNQPRMSLQVRFSNLADPFFNKVNFNFSKEHNIFSYSDALKYISVHRGK